MLSTEPMGGRRATYSQDDVFPVDDQFDLTDAEATALRMARDADLRRACPPPVGPGALPGTKITDHD